MLQNVIPRDVYLEELKAAVPEADDLVTEHLADNGELLLHLIMSDLLRMTIRTFHEGNQRSAAGFWSESNFPAGG